MECAKHAVQGTVINNKIKQFLMVRVTIEIWQVAGNYGKWQQGHKVKSKKVNAILPVV